MKYLVVLFCSFNIWSCGDADEPNQMGNSDLPNISISDATTSERDGARLDFSLTITGEVSTSFPVNYTLMGITATPDEDFSSSSGSITIEPGTSNATITITIVDDTIKELDEKFQITISNSSQFNIDDVTAIGIIRDNDDLSSFDELGYFTPSSYFGYNLSWADEFDGAELSDENYNYEVGDGCDLGICGWGNNELQTYTSEAKNNALIDGKLVITAIEESPNVYTSARITTKGKHKFRFGRIDIRAKLPFGQGVWPALWMLGSNIDDKGWPSCGEIDIMEMVGHIPNETLGTAHWGTSPGPSIHSSGKKRISEDFNEAFHVFTMEWTLNEMNWYVDEEKFHTIAYDQLNGAANPFINEFFFIFNIAVGGNLPGAPDESTIFPQTMEVDYVRVFQLK